MSDFQTKIIKQLEKKGYTVLKTIRLNKTGYPDVFAMKKGHIDIWIECKEEKDTLKTLQRKRIDELNALGKVAVCIQKGKGVIYPESEIYQNIFAIINKNN